MKGRTPGRPTKWVRASVSEKFYVGKAGLVIEVRTKWSKRKHTKLGTLTASVGGLRWAPSGGKARKRSWNAVHDWFLSKG